MEGERRGERPKRITRRELLGLERLGEWFKTKNQHSSVNVGVGSKTTPEREAASEVGRSLFDFLHNLYLPRRSSLKISGSVIATFLLAACGGKNRTGGGSGTEDQTKEVSVTPSATLEPATPTEEPAAPKEQPTATPTLEHYQLLFEELRSSIVQIEDKYPDAGFFIRSGVGEQSEIDKKLTGNFFSEGTQFISQEANLFDGYSPEEKQLLVQISQQYEQLETEHGYYMGVNIPQDIDFQVQVSNPTDNQTYINFKQDYNLDKELSLQFSAIRFYKEDGQLKVALRAENAIVGSGHDVISGSVWVSMDAGSALQALQGGGQMTSVAIARSVQLTGRREQLQNAQVALSYIAENLNGYEGKRPIDFLELTRIKGVPDGEVDSLGYVWGYSLSDGQSIPEVAGGLCGGGTGGDRLVRQALLMQGIDFESKRQVHEHSSEFPTNYIFGTADPNYRDHDLFAQGRFPEMEWDTTLATHSNGEPAANSIVTPKSESAVLTVDDTVLMSPTQEPYLIQFVTVKVD